MEVHCCDFQYKYILDQLAYAEEKSWRKKKNKCYDVHLMKKIIEFSSQWSNFEDKKANVEILWTNSCRSPKVICHNRTLWNIPVRRLLMIVNINFFFESLN